MGYSTYFFQPADLSVSYSFDLSIALYAVAIVSVFISWFFVAHFRRQTLYLSGLFAMCVILLISGLSLLATGVLVPGGR